MLSFPAAAATITHSGSFRSAKYHFNYNGRERRILSPRIHWPDPSFQRICIHSRLGLEACWRNPDRVSFTQTFFLLFSPFLFSVSWDGTWMLDVIANQRRHHILAEALFSQLQPTFCTVQRTRSRLKAGWRLSGSFTSFYPQYFFHVPDDEGNKINVLVFLSLPVLVCISLTIIRFHFSLWTENRICSPRGKLRLFDCITNMQLPARYIHT